MEFRRFDNSKQIGLPFLYPQALATAPEATATTARCGVGSIICQQKYRYMVYAHCACVYCLFKYLFVGAVVFAHEVRLSAMKTNSKKSTAWSWFWFLCRWQFGWYWYWMNIEYKVENGVIPIRCHIQVHRTPLVSTSTCGPQICVILPSKAGTSETFK